MGEGRGVRLGVQLRLDTALRPSMQHYLALLGVPAEELEATIERALAANPLLARAPGGPCLGCGRHCPSGTWCAACSAGPLPAEPAEPVGWRQRIERDARLELSRREHALLTEVIGSLDDHGLLAPGALAAATDPDQLAAVVAAVRRVGPPGIAAPTPLDCVRCQVDDLVARGLAPPLAATLMTEHAADVAAGRLGEVAEHLGVGVDAVAAALSTVRQRVTPYVALEDPGPRPAVVDVAFRRHRRDPGRLVVEVVDAGWFGLVLDQELWAWASGEAREWLRPHRADALRLLAELRARAGMLHRLAVLLGDRQRGYLLEGPAGHRPLTRAQAARELACHPATVGRAVAGKWARCPDGRVVPLSAFFGGRTAVLLALEDLLATRPGASDETLRGLLADRGFPLARRTVAKYRHLLLSGAPGPRVP